MREIKPLFDIILTDIGVKNVITNYMPLEVSESILFWRSNIILLIATTMTRIWTPSRDTQLSRNDPARNAGQLTISGQFQAFRDRWCSLFGHPIWTKSNIARRSDETVCGSSELNSESLWLSYTFWDIWAMT